MIGFFCSPHVYQYSGWLFEWHSYCGPWPLRQDGELRARAGRRFWAMIKGFQQLTEAERAACEVGRGGCIPLGEAPP